MLAELRPMFAHIVPRPLPLPRAPAAWALEPFTGADALIGDGDAVEILDIF